MTDTKLEVCVDCLVSIKNATMWGAEGADRLELCSALSEGGLTPTVGLLKLAKRISTIPVFAMIRIRGGSFIYDADEQDAMLDDLRDLKSAGADGFVFGALTHSGEIDATTCSRFIEAASPLSVTFHRAFDEAVEPPFEALETICSLGFTRLLTSGRQKSAEAGAELISKLIERADGRIVVMPGAGVHEGNVSSVREKTGAKEIHGSARGDVSPEHGLTSGVTLTDSNKVRMMKRRLKED